MISSELLSTLKEYLNMHSNLYVETQSYIQIGLEDWKHIRERCNRALTSLDCFTDDKGTVVVDESNIDALTLCIEAIRACTHAQSSWHRAYLVWIVYRFLSFFKWRGNRPEMESYDSWGPLIYELSRDQLAFYLWWRQEANRHIFHEATAAYVWLFIYEKLLNVARTEPSNETLAILESTYLHYRENYPRPIHKRLTVEKLGHLIFNYALYNGMYDNIQELGNEYGVDDDYPLYKRLSEGKYTGLGRYLLEFASSDIKTKSFTGSEEETYSVQMLPLVLEKIYKAGNALRNLLRNDICGEYDPHVSWDFFETPVLSANIAKYIEHGVQKSFSLNGNIYVLATGETLSSDQDYVNNQYSGYFNDRGDRFHINGYYYRSQFSGITTEGKQLIDYLFREIQVFYRAERGLRSLKRKSCPYAEYENQINESIQQCLEYHKLSRIITQREENLNKIDSFDLLSQEEVKVPSKFRYIRETHVPPKVILSGHNDDAVTEILEISDNVEEIAPMAYAGCRNLQAVTGGFGLKKIGIGAFYDCSSLRTVVLQDGTECIEDGAFIGCTNLEEILIPMSVNRIGSHGGNCIFEGSPVILCEMYTAAYYYAVEYNLSYKVLERE